MGKIKFLHCADIHLDAAFTSLGSDSVKCSLRRQDLKDTFKQIIDTAREENTDILMISGDLYEHGYSKKQTISYINHCFDEIPHTMVVIIPGNHDPDVSNSFYRSIKWSDNVHILSRDNPYLHLPSQGVCIYGSGFDGLSDSRYFAISKRQPEPSEINILMLHGTLDMSFSKNTFNPVSARELSILGMDYIALGHFHSRITAGGLQKNVYNPGSPEPLGFDEPGEHGIFAGTLEKSSASLLSSDIRFIKLNRKYYIKTDVDITGCDTNEQIISRIIGKTADFDMPSGLFSVALTGYKGQGFKPDIFQLQSYFENRCFFIRLSDETAVDYDFEAIAKEPGIRGLFVKKLLSRMENSPDEEERAMLLKALYLGIEALEQGKLEVSGLL